MTPYLIDALKTTQFYANANLHDIPADSMCSLPSEGMNHPAWIVGHIVLSYESVLESFGHAAPPRDGWQELFSRGAPRTDDPADYPTKDELLAAFNAVHDRMAEIIPTLQQAQLDTPTPDIKLREIFPTLGHALFGVVTYHEGIHLGQLAAWRAAMKMELPV